MPETKSVTIRDPKNITHTNHYFTIDYKLIEYVGKDKFEEFKNKFAGTEDFNIVKFVKYFDISKEEFLEIYKEKWTNGYQIYLFRKFQY